MTPHPLVIAPSILSADFARLGEEIRRVEKAGADWVHVDVMDGHFVPNLTIGPVVVHWLKKCTALPLDVHLMIEHPEKYIPEFAKAGAWNITIHWEACRRPLDVLRLIKDHGCRAGISVRPRTPIQKIAPLLNELDLVLVMTVEPGFGGQSFMPDMMPKVRWLQDKFAGVKRSKRPWIEVDGGINNDTAPIVVQSGADALVAGNAIFAAPNPATALKTLRHRAQTPIL
ncbi:MAG: ribulose-phosphate 3-epimerase [Elusimicrobia bacterium]|jgi:ribulose-phosphate 3-epimerase|nr:ribulose-phosphate 3-epimerase [Elusimicrobiota bacterium]